MKKGKKKTNNNNTKLMKCNICLNQYKSENLDKHMHSRTHHEAIERLTGREQMHRCWACGVSVFGLEQFSQHVETQQHDGELASLKQRTESGFAVDYDDDELNALCALRDRHRFQLKLQKQKEKLKRQRERKAARFQEAFNQKSQLKDKDWSEQGNKSVVCPLNNGNKQEMMKAEPVLQPISIEGAAPESPPAKKQCLRDGPSTKSRFTSSVCGGKVESERASQSTPRAPRLIQSHVDRLSMMLKSIRKSLEAERLPAGSSEDPDRKLAKGEEFKRNEHGEETTPPGVPRLSEKCPQESSTKSQKCEARTCETERKSIHPPSSDDPQEEAEPTLTGHVLPTPTSRSVTETEANEPSVNTARGIRTSQEEIRQEAAHRKLQTDKRTPSSYPTERRDREKAAETTNHTSRPADQNKRDVGENHSASEMSGSSGVTPLGSLACVKNEKSDDYCSEAMQEKACHDRILIPVTQIKQKKQDFPNTDRLKGNSPKHQMNELLVMCLREDELCSSLENVDGRLFWAQAALQNAFVEVHRLQMIKQQVTAEISSLRNKHTDILQKINKSRLDQASRADSPGSAVQTHPRAAGSSGQHRDAALDRSSLLMEVHADGRSETHGFASFSSSLRVTKDAHRALQKHRYTPSSTQS